MSKFDEGQLREIEKIKDMLGTGEQVLFCSRQSRFLPGGSIVTPNTIFATNLRVIIRSPTALGLRAGVEDYHYKNITGVKLQKGMFSTQVFLTIPGRTELSRSPGLLRWDRGDEAELAALPHDEAVELQRIINDGIAGRLPGQVVPTVIPQVPKKLCGSCGKEVSPEFTVCPYCGTRLKGICPSCSREVASDFAFCPFCGTRLR